MKSYNSNNVYYKIISILLLFIIWEVLFFIIGNKNIFPSFLMVLNSIKFFLSNKLFYLSLLNTTLSSVLSFFLAFCISILIVYISYISLFFNSFIHTLMNVLKSFPIASFTILFIIWIKSTHLPLAVSFFMTLPIIYEVMISGIKKVDSGLIESAEIQNISKTKIYFCIILFNIKGAIIGSLNATVSVAFKSTVAAEVIALIGKSIGNSLYESKIFFDVDKVFAITFILIVVIKLVELLLNYIINKIIKP